tara:strand:+ start:3489 stop:4469 length:981 start_codon:yes stop_codon:yes gene_type:complete
LKQKNNNIEELLKDKFHSLEADPGANAWANVQSGISSGMASSSLTAAASSWVFSTTVGVIITAVAVGGFFFFHNEGEKKIQPKQETMEVPLIEKELEVDSEQQEHLLENVNEISTSTNHKFKKVKEASYVVEVDNNEPIKLYNSNELDKEVPVDKATKIIKEKTIDEILAEHQQFLEEQAAVRKNLSVTNNTANSKITEPSNNVKKSDAEVTNSSTIDNKAEIGVIEEQKRIAKQVIFPNAFSPDLDGKNDIFKMTIAQSIEVDNIQVDILNAQGKLIDSFTGIYEGWGGKLMNGSFAPTGNYIYQAIIYVDGKRIPKIGGFTLNR